jgi:hypothetical protein
MERFGIDFEQAQALEALAMAAEQQSEQDIARSHRLDAYRLYELVQDPRVGRCSVCGDLNGHCSTGECPAEELPRRRQVTPACQPDVDDLAELVDRPVQICPPAGDPDLGLDDEPPVTRDMKPRPGCLDELRCEPLI